MPVVIQSALSKSDFLGANGSVLSSFFLSRKALNELAAGLEGTGPKLYMDEGALGSSGFELLEAEDSVRL